jgi:hypothetical protein
MHPESHLGQENALNDFLSGMDSETDVQRVINRAELAVSIAGNADVRESFYLSLRQLLEEANRGDFGEYYYLPESRTRAVIRESLRNAWNRWNEQQRSAAIASTQQYALPGVTSSITHVPDKTPPESLLRETNTYIFVIRTLQAEQKTKQKQAPKKHQEGS